MAVVIQLSTDVQQFHPFERVYKRIVEGTDQSLSLYFSTLIPQSLTDV